MTDIIERLRIESRREPHEPIWRNAIDEIEALRAEVERLAKTLQELEERKQCDEALLRQALEALEQIATDLPWELTGLQADTIAALRERLST